MEGSAQSSASTKHRYSPRARSMARLRAAGAPAFSWWMTVMRTSRVAYRSRMRPESSGEPSSTQMSSMSRRVWPRMDSTARPTYFSTPQTGMITLTLGWPMLLAYPLLITMLPIQSRCGSPFSSY